MFSQASVCLHGVSLLGVSLLREGLPPEGHLPPEGSLPSEGDLPTEGVFMDPRPDTVNQRSVRLLLEGNLVSSVLV